MAVFEVLFPEWLHSIVQFSEIFWKLFWRLHRLSVYMEEDTNLNLEYYLHKFNIKAHKLCI